MCDVWKHVPGARPGNGSLGEGLWPGDLEFGTGQQAGQEAFVSLGAERGAPGAMGTGVETGGRGRAALWERRGCRWWALADMP